METVLVKPKSVLVSGESSGFASRVASCSVFEIWLFGRSCLAPGFFLAVWSLSSPGFMLQDFIRTGRVPGQSSG